MGGGGTAGARNQEAVAAPDSVTEQNWGSVLTLGVEEELMLVDERTLEQRPLSGPVIEAVRADRGVVKHELFASIVELNTGICSTPDEAVEVLRALRDATARAARDVGCAIVAAGSHPFDRPDAQPIADDPHYRRFIDYAGPAARRQGVQGLHVHVGMPDAATCLRTMETIIPWLPLVLALSANSPWFEGKRTGMLSNRAEVLALLPRHSAPPRFDSWADWEQLVRRFRDAGVINQYGAIHWDVRPHPRWGTLEVRMPDQPTALGRVGAFVELIRGLCAWALERPASPPEASSRVVYDQNRFAAARFGPRATMIHPDRDAPVVAEDLYAELAERIDSNPLDGTCEGDLQLAFDDPRAAAADLVTRSLP